jgi:hypothetical protein
MVETAAVLFGIVFLIIGILRFAPAASPPNGMLLERFLFVGFGATGSEAPV